MAILLETLRRIKRELGVEPGPVEQSVALPSARRSTPVRDILKLKFEYGEAYGDVAKTWYRVNFTKPIQNPIVLATGFVSTTSKPNIKVSLVGRVPSVSVPAISDVPKITSISLTYVPVRTIERVTLTRREIENKIKEQAGDWGVFNWMRDAIAYVFSVVLKWMYDVIVGTVIDKVEDSLNDTIRDINNRFSALVGGINTRFSSLVTNINNRLKLLRDNTNSALSTLTSNINTAFENQTKEIEKQINNALSALLDAWGISPNYKLVSVMIRNVNSRGFEWYSLGKMRIFWLALGERTLPSA